MIVRRSTFWYVSIQGSVKKRPVSEVRGERIDKVVGWLALNSLCLYIGHFKRA